MMTRSPTTCGPDDTLREARACNPGDSLVEAQAITQETRVRRLPVVDESERLLGVIPLADLACEAERERGSITRAEIGKILVTLREPPDIGGEAVAAATSVMVGP